MPRKSSHKHTKTECEGIMLACDLECGEFVVNTEDLGFLRTVCGEQITVIWEQGCK